MEGFMQKQYSAICENVSKWRTFFIYRTVQSKKLENSHFRLQFAYLLKCSAFFFFFDVAYPPSHQTDLHFSETVSSADIDAFTPQMNEAIFVLSW